MNLWRNYVWMAAGVSALSLVVAFTAKPLLAQIRASLMQNVDEPGRTPYMSFASSTGCALKDACIARFAPIPMGKRLVATNITGTVQVQTPGLLRGADLVFHRLMAIQIYSIPTLLQTGVFNGGSTNIVGINAPLGLYIDGPDQPTLNVVTSSVLSTDFGSLGLSVALSGYLVDCSAAGSCAAIVQ